jgi:hypothetical protein
MTLIFAAMSQEIMTEYVERTVSRQNDGRVHFTDVTG